MLGKLLAGLMLLTTLFAHAQCMHVHHSDEEMEEIAALNRNEKHDWY